MLVGDFLFSRAFQLMVEDGSLDVLRILSNASAVIAEGEVLQLTTANDTETTESAYLEVIKAKTATLFAAAARVGAVVAGRPRAEEEALDELRHESRHRLPAGRRRARLRQPRRDLGKSVGDDFRDGKITLPVVLAFLRGDEERARLLAPHARGARPARRRPRARDRAAAAARLAARFRRAGERTTARSPATRSASSPTTPSSARSSS